tara:strand:- start:354 stop:1505 length:1152 start_codon:yes stop_codon:yes gene_type:complete
MGASNHDNHQDPLSDNPETKVVHAQYAKDSPGNETRFPPRIIVEQQGRILRRTFFVILLIALGISILFNFGLLAQYQSYIQSDPEIIEFLQSGSRVAVDKVAILDVEGTILRGDGFVKKQIDRIKNDENVRGVVLRVNSPGGTVTASHYLYHHLKELQQHKRSDDQPFPLVVSMGGMAASGGYYISMAVGDAPNTIFAEDTTWTGSIGVVIPSYDFSGFLSKHEIVDYSYVSGKFKQMGSFTRKRTPEASEKLQELVDESFSGFLRVVSYGRPKVVANENAMREIKTGQIFTAQQALRLGLVDKIGFLEDATERVAELAALNDGEYRVVRYQQPIGLVDTLLGGQMLQNKESQFTLSDWATPRAYYLSTWLPALTQNIFELYR